MFRLPKTASKNQYFKIRFVFEQKYGFILTAELMVLPAEVYPVKLHKGQNIGTTSIMLVELCIIQIKPAEENFSSVLPFCYSLLCLYVSLGRDLQNWLLSNIANVKANFQSALAGCTDGI